MEKFTKDFDIKVIVYSKPNCMQCRTTMRWMDQNGVEYQKVDVQDDQTAYDHVVGLGYQSLPVVEVEGQESWSGFRPDKLQQLKVNYVIQDSGVHQEQE